MAGKCHILSIAQACSFYTAPEYLPIPALILHSQISVGWELWVSNPDSPLLASLWRQAALCFSTPANCFLFSSSSLHLLLLNVLTISLDLPCALLLFLYTDSFWCAFCRVPPLAWFVSASVVPNEAKAIPPLFFVSQTNCVFDKISFSKFLLSYFSFPFRYLPRRSKPHIPELDFNTSVLLSLFSCFHSFPSLLFVEWYCCISDELRTNDCPFSSSHLLPLSVRVF